MGETAKPRCDQTKGASLFSIGPIDAG